MKENVVLIFERGIGFSIKYSTRNCNKCFNNPLWLLDNELKVGFLSSIFTIGLFELFFRRSSKLLSKHSSQIQYTVLYYAVLHLDLFSQIHHYTIIEILL